MTCIVALKNKQGKIYIGADRRVSWDFSQAQGMPRPKVRKRGEMIIAGTGDSYLCTLIVDILHIPQVPDYVDTDIYMHHHFYEATRKLLIAKNFCNDNKVLKVGSDTSAEIVIALNGRLYILNIKSSDELHPEFSIGRIEIDEVSLPYGTGCGGQWAWGSLLTTESFGMKTKARIELALGVAAKVAPGCGDGIDIEHEV